MKGSDTSWRRLKGHASGRRASRQACFCRRPRQTCRPPLCQRSRGASTRRPPRARHAWRSALATAPAVGGGRRWPPAHCPRPQYGHETHPRDESTGPMCRIPNQRWPRRAGWSERAALAVATKRATRSSCQMAAQRSDPASTSATRRHRLRRVRDVLACRLSRRARRT